MDEMQALQQQRPQRAAACIIERQQLPEMTPAYILKDATGRHYMRLSDDGLFVWRLIDGKRTVRDLCTAYVARSRRPAPDEVLQALARLLEAGFITFEDARRDRYAASPGGMGKRHRLSSLCTRYYCLRDMDGRVAELYRHLRLIYTPLAQAALLLAAIAGAIAFAGHCTAHPFSPATALPRQPLVWLGCVVLHIVVHEGAHALTCKHFGRAVHRAGIGWYYFAPVAFVDTSDIWAATRLQRVLVSAAGPYANLVLAGVAAVAALLPAPGGLEAVLWSFAGMGYVLALVNINPLLELDGYYMLMDLLEIPDLRARALADLGSVLRGRAGAEPRLRGVFMLFGAACLAYGLATALGVLLTYRMLIGHRAADWLPSSYAQGIGWALAGAMSLLVVHRLIDGLRLGGRQQ